MEFSRMYERRSKWSKQVAMNCVPIILILVVSIQGQLLQAYGRRSRPEAWGRAPGEWGRTRLDENQGNRQTAIRRDRPLLPGGGNLLYGFSTDASGITMIMSDIMKLFNTVVTGRNGLLQNNGNNGVFGGRSGGYAVGTMSFGIRSVEDEFEKAVEDRVEQIIENDEKTHQKEELERIGRDLKEIPMETLHRIRDFAMTLLENQHLDKYDLLEAMLSERDDDEYSGTTKGASLPQLTPTNISPIKNSIEDLNFHLTLIVI